MYKAGAETNELRYSTDDGETWQTFQFFQEVGFGIFGLFYFVIYDHLQKKNCDCHISLAVGGIDSFLALYVHYRKNDCA